MKETLAAGLVLLSRWDSSRILADPFCGSGTIPVEAAMIGRNMAPGFSRDLLQRSGLRYLARVWQEVRDEARRISVHRAG